MSWDRTIDLIYDVGADPSSPLLKVESNSVSVGVAPVLIAGDHINLRIYLRKLSGDGVWEPVTIPSGFSIIFAGKMMSGTPSGSLLFSAVNFVFVDPGDGLLERLGKHYACDLNLNTTELLSAVASKSEITVRCDLQIQNSGNTRRYTMQADFKVRNQAYAGEGAPESGDPEYPLPDQIALREPESGNYRFEGGTELKFKNLVTDAFETIDARIESGIRLVKEDGGIRCYVDGVPGVLLR